MLDLYILFTGLFRTPSASSPPIPNYGVQISSNDAHWSHQERPPRGKLIPNPQLVSDTSFLDL